MVDFYNSSRYIYLQCSGDTSEKYTFETYTLEKYSLKSKVVNKTWTIQYKGVLIKLQKNTI